MSNWTKEVLIPEFTKKVTIVGETNLGKTAKTKVIADEVEYHKGGFRPTLDMFDDEFSHQLTTTHIPKDGSPVRLGFDVTKVLKDYSSLQQEFDLPDLDQLFPSKLSKIREKYPSSNEMSDEELDNSIRRYEEKLQGTYFYNTKSGPYSVVLINQWAEPGQGGFEGLRKLLYSHIKGPAERKELIFEGMISVAPDELENSMEVLINRIETVKGFLGSDFEKCTFRTLCQNKLDLNRGFKEIPSNLEGRYDDLLEVLKPHIIYNASVLDCAKKKVLEGGKFKTIPGNREPLVEPYIKGTVALVLLEKGVPIETTLRYI